MSAKPMQASAMLRTLLILGEDIDEREEAAEKQAQRPKRQRDQAVAERRADIGAHDHADGGSERNDAGIDEADDHDGHGGGGLDDAGDERAGEDALDRRAGDLRQPFAHAVDRQAPECHWP